ncbi:hypothetical protein CEXT_772591 [Caerostris extrusa]|uniref:Uncharacterized protein n=1 Tax=Caerostris extrusa TaxID=172846 RepID=A0AAV4NSW0_CAEEX|nr:hypothetical protein CEXT_772591 [Caerostris extrusa]
MPPPQSCDTTSDLRRRNATSHSSTPLHHAEEESVFPRPNTTITPLKPRAVGLFFATRRSKWTESCRARLKGMIYEVTQNANFGKLNLKPRELVILSKGKARTSVTRTGLKCRWRNGAAFIYFCLSSAFAPKWVIKRV